MKQKVVVELNSNIGDLFQAAAGKDSVISVSRVAWSPDGNFVGAFARVERQKWHCNLQGFGQTTNSLKCRCCIYQTFDSFVCFSWSK